MNRKTGEKCTEQPDSWDGHYIIGSTARKDLEYDRTFGDFTQKFCTKIDDADDEKAENVGPQKVSEAGIIGQWELVESDEDFFQQNRADSDADC